MTSKQLQDRFLPRFIPVARQRLLRCREAIEGGPGDPSYELHALAGEAATLGLEELAALARHAGGLEAERLERLEAELVALAARGRG